MSSPASPDAGRARGGPQVIPRPAGARPGGPPPWVHLSPAERSLVIDDVAKVFATLGDALPSAREHQPGTERASAVLAPLFERDGEPAVLLTRRTMHLRSHRGEVSFPGGRREPGEDLRGTALREAHEEVGLDPASVTIVGELDHLSTITSGSFIVPFVGLLDRPPDGLVPNPHEVDTIREVALSELLDPAHYREEMWPLFGALRPIYFFELEGDTVWGATGAMLRQLLGFLTGTLGRGDLGHA